MATNKFKGAYGEEIIEWTGNTGSSTSTTHRSSIFTFRPGTHIHWIWDGPDSISSSSTQFDLEWSMDGETWIGSYTLQSHSTAVNSDGVIDPHSTSGVSNGVFYRMSYTLNAAEGTSYPFKAMLIVPNPNFNQ
jgi:hypothetical protein